MKLIEYIDNQIKKYGAKNFFDNVNNAWNSYESDIKKMILDYTFEKIKPTKIETIEDLAKLLNNNERGFELDHELYINIEDLCEMNKWVIMFPYSDDNVELRGFIDDEVGCYDTSYIKFLKEGDFYEDENEYNTYHKAIKNGAICVDKNHESDVECAWDDDENYVWRYTVLNDKLPHAYFNILDDDIDEENKIWARCCVIDLLKIM